MDITYTWFGRMQPPPANVREALAVWPKLVDKEQGLVGRALNRLCVFAFRDTDLELWQVTGAGDDDVVLDDLVRAVCWQGDPPIAVIVPRVEVIRDSHGKPKAYFVRAVAECGGHRAVMETRVEADGEPRPGFTRTEELPMRAPGWIGIPPSPHRAIKPVGRLTPRPATPV